jgi:hypothetical protein
VCPLPAAFSSEKTLFADDFIFVSAHTIVTLIPLVRTLIVHLLSLSLFSLAHTFSPVKVSPKDSPLHPHFNLILLL